MNKFSQQSGFTLMEIVVSTAIFATTLTLMMTLFNYTLQINRRVEAMRQVAQLTRGFTEPLIREIRNGRIDYESLDINCDPSFYQFPENRSLAIISPDGTRLCYYLNVEEQALYISKNTNAGYLSERITPDNVTMNPDTFRFVIKPDINPTDTPAYISQPFVTILAKFSIQLAPGETPTVIPYQTTISSDVYNPNLIPHAD